MTTRSVSIGLFTVLGVIGVASIILVLNGEKFYTDSDTATNQKIKRKIRKK